MDLRNISIEVYGRYYQVIVHEWKEYHRDLITYKLEVRELNIFYMFSIDSLHFLHLRESKELDSFITSHLSRFKVDIEQKVFNPNKYLHCTKELILEKYFESYLNSRETLYAPVDQTSILKNPNLILGRRKGHTQALVDFVTDVKNEEIVKDSFIVFPTYIQQNDFLLRLNEDVRQRVFSSLISESYQMRGQRKSFIIFNSYMGLSNRIPEFLYNCSFKSHYIILGN